jgi:hypothetical protein
MWNILYDVFSVKCYYWRKNAYYRIEVTKSAFINETARTRRGYDVCMECRKKFINWVKDEKRKAKE